MRARNIKPSFFKNDSLASLPFASRLLFIGLWCLSDREGRTDDNPRKIKGELFPYNRVRIEEMLSALASKNFIVRYENRGHKYIQIVNFKKHQYPHSKEPASTIPAPNSPGTSMVPILLNPESPILNPESPIPESGTGVSSAAPGEGEFKHLSDVDKVVMVYKLVLGFEAQDAEWDARNLERFRAPARALLEIFKGDGPRASQYIEDFAADAVKRGMKFTLETMVKNFDQWRLENGDPRTAASRV